MPRHRVARSQELAEGSMLQVEAGGGEVLLVRTGGRLHAVGAHCPHYHAPLAEGTLNGCRLVCPWHQSVFDVTSGALLEPPALDALPRFEVGEEDGHVWVEVPDEVPHHAEPAHAPPTGDGRTAVVYGAGAAGTMAALELRRSGFAGRVILLTREERSPYDRPNCSKDYLAGQAEPEWMPLRPDEELEKLGIEKLVREVDEVDVPTRRLRLTDGSELQPDLLLLAPGAVPRRLDLPGADLDGVHLLRTWDDADRVIASAEGVRRAVVAGSSFIGMEVAASLRARGLEVTVVSPDEVPFVGVLGREVGSAFVRLHEANGVAFRLGRKPAAFHGDGRLSAVELDAGERLDCGLAVLGVGVRPATANLRGVTLCEDGGIPVDEHLQVADGVWAAGDVAAFPDWRTGKRIRIEHWRLAQQLGMTAAHNMAGRREAFRRVPFFWTMQHGEGLAYVGHAAGWDEVILHGDPEAFDFIAFYLRDGRALAAAAMHRDDQMGAFHELMLADRVPSPERLRQGVDLAAELRR